MVKKSFIKFLVFVGIILFAGVNVSYAQSDVELIATGDGSTKQEAILSALRSGIEQSFGAFVSSNTKILDDQLVKDEIISLSSGNVKEYKILSEGMVDTKWVANVWMSISLNNLVKYTMSKGASVELSGANTLVMNSKLKKMNQKNALKAMYSMEEQIIDLFPSCFDYEIELYEPASRNNFENYVWPTKISISMNSNINIVQEKLQKINELNKKFFGYFKMENLLWSLREKIILFIMGGLTIKDDFGTYKFKHQAYSSDYKISIPPRESEIRPRYERWSKRQEGKFLQNQFLYIGGEDKALVWAGSRNYGIRLVAFKYNYFHYVDPIDGYLEGNASTNYHFWYNHDNRFFLPKSDDLIDFQVYTGKTDHGIFLSQFSDRFFTMSSPSEGQCVLSFPLTMFYNEAEMMKAKSISVFFNMSDEQKRNIKGTLVMEKYLKW